MVTLSPRAGLRMRYLVRGLGGLLFIAGQASEASGEGVGDAEFHCSTIVACKKNGEPFFAPDQSRSASTRCRVYLLRHASRLCWHAPDKVFRLHQNKDSAHTQRMRNPHRALSPLWAL